MRHLAAALLLALPCACKTRGQREAEEKKSLDRSVQAAEDRTHELKTKEILDGQLSEADAAERKRLEEQAAEDRNGGNSPPPAPEPPGAP